MGRREWIKIYTDKWLRGSLREESSALRGIFADIVALAGDSAFGDDGVIKLSSQVALTDDQIAGVLKINIDEWLKAKERLKKTDRISVDARNIITVTNWKKYQSEYRRQRAYRKKASKNRGRSSKVIGGSYREKEKEKENKNTFMHPLLDPRREL